MPALCEGSYEIEEWEHFLGTQGSELFGKVGAELDREANRSI